VNRRSVYRYFEAGALELVPRQGGKAWVSIRSIAEFMKKHYAPSDDFNALVAMDSRPPTKWDNWDIPLNPARAYCIYGCGEDPRPRKGGITMPDNPLVPFIETAIETATTILRNGK
jgi:hypothetical protein